MLIMWNTLEKAEHLIFIQRLRRAGGFLGGGYLPDIALNLSIPSPLSRFRCSLRRAGDGVPRLLNERREQYRNHAMSVNPQTNFSCSFWTAQIEAPSRRTLTSHIEIKSSDGGIEVHRVRNSALHLTTFTVVPTTRVKGKLPVNVDLRRVRHTDEGDKDNYDEQSLFRHLLNPWVLLSSLSFKPLEIEMVVETESCFGAFLWALWRVVLHCRACDCCALSILIEVLVMKIDARFWWSMMVEEFWGFRLDDGWRRRVHDELDLKREKLKVDWMWKKKLKDRRARLKAMKKTEGRCWRRWGEYL